MKIIDKVDKMKTYARIMKKQNKLIGFVPTMGYLHQGHHSLIDAARKQTDCVIASVFVNPIQFGPNEDYKSYPRDLKRDEELAKASGVDVLFYPSKDQMYPPEFSTYVHVEKLTETLCGKSRPGHFRGVTTCVMKLFEIIKPDIAYFGQKDAQQAFTIKKMVRDLNMDITMKILPTVREEGGLAMSSRNERLTKSERRDALVLYKSLELAREIIASGEADPKKVVKKMRDLFSGTPSAKIDYIEIVDTKRLKNVSVIRGEVLIAVACFIGKARLIDNIIFSQEKPHERTEHVELLTG